MSPRPLACQFHCLLLHHKGSTITHLHVNVASNVLHTHSISALYTDSWLFQCFLCMGYMCACMCGPPHSRKINIIIIKFTCIWLVQILLTIFGHAGLLIMYSAWCTYVYTNSRFTLNFVPTRWDQPVEIINLVLFGVLLLLVQPLLGPASYRLPGRFCWANIIVDTRCCNHNNYNTCTSYTCDLSVVASVDEVHASAGDIIILIGSYACIVVNLINIIREWSIHVYGLGKQLHLGGYKHIHVIKHLSGNATACGSSKLPIGLSIILSLSLGGETENQWLENSR